ncbi:hypothetical protein WA026_012658 [Henosepilachna vigintioctopunctata]|uniref:Uncharacterized protein n=1 Tax=Henosepilachna vigintioctopunctata TaxID=420089 RepID=A0AAW1U0D0_9CUCU
MQSLTSSLNRLSALVNEQNVDAIALTEHWRSRTQQQVCYFQGYELLSNFYRLKGQYGGSLIYCRESLKG